MSSGITKAIRHWFLTPEADVESQVTFYGTRGRSGTAVGSSPSFFLFTLLETHTTIVPYESVTAP
jgi:hypothetical protein